MPFEQRLMPLESFSQLKGMKVNAFSEDLSFSAESVAQQAGDARAWIDTPQPTRSKECEKGRAEVLGTFSARAHRECRETVWCVRLRRSRS